MVDWIDWIFVFPVKWVFFFFWSLVWVYLSTPQMKQPHNLQESTRNSEILTKRKNKETKRLEEPATTIASIV